MRADEAEYGSRWPTIHAFIEAHLVEPGQPTESPQGCSDSAALDRFLLETVLALGGQD